MIFGDSMKKEQIYLAACLLLIMTNFIPAYSRAYFVATNGDDGNDGSISAPWKTFDYALSIVSAADTLNIRGGNYQQSISTVNDGTDENAGAIVIRAYPGENVLLQGNNYQGQGIAIQNSYIKIEGIEDSLWSEGMAISSPAHHITLTNCNVHDMDYGISVYSGTHDITLRNCEMYKFGNFGFDATATKGTGPENEISRVLLINCYSHDADFSTPAANPDGNADGFAFGHFNERDVTLINCTAVHTGDGFDLDGVNVTVINCTARNTTYQFGGGFKCWADTVNLFNCLSYNNLNTGIELDENPDNVAIDKKTVTNIINCTTVDNGYYNVTVEGTTKVLNMYNTLIVGGIKYNDSTTPRGLVFAAAGHAAYTGDYNIFHSFSDDSYIIDMKPDEIDYNSDNLPEWQSSSGQDIHSMFFKNIDSVFVNRQGQDFHLKAGSGAINKGSSANSYPIDHDSIPRNDTPDIGCYEYNSGTSVNDDMAVHSQSLFTFFPNPVNDNLTVYYPFDNNSITFIKINNELGISVYEKQNVNCTGYNNSININTCNLTPGVYFLTLKAGNNIETKKFVIIR
jgi:hypothetical protein